MVFKKALQAHQELVSSEATAKALKAAGEAAARQIRLQACIDQLQEVVIPLFEQFVKEATADDYHASWSFSSDPYRCWWSLQFVPDRGEAPRDSPFERNENVASALVRTNSEGEVSLEMHDNTRKFSHLTPKQRLTRLPVAEVTSERIEAWLGEFVSVSLEARRKSD